MNVSVVMITYGHEKFIAQAIESVLSQKFSNSLELIVSNDCSPDNTDCIIQKIMKNHPRAHCIRYIRHDKNVGIMPNFIQALNSANFEYVALCDGDDYWTDPYKLQKQINFLESNPEYSMAVHNALVIYEDLKKRAVNFSNAKVDFDVSLESLIKKWFIPTASMVFRRAHSKDLPDWFKNIYSADFSLALIMSNHGKIKFFCESMSVYRVNYSGTSASAIYSNKSEFVLNQHILLLENFSFSTTMENRRIVFSKIKQLKKELLFLNYKYRSKVLTIIYMPNFTIQKLIRKYIFIIRNL
jgi:glycosyltransferase involved in cell wall biosynthesis